MRGIALSAYFVGLGAMILVVTRQKQKFWMHVELSWWRLPPTDSFDYLTIDIQMVQRGEVRSLSWGKLLGPCAAFLS